MTDDSYRKLLDSLLSPWFEGAGRAGSSDAVTRVRGAQEAAGRALDAVLSAGNVPLKAGGTVHVLTNSSAASRDVRHFLSAWFADIEELAPLQAKSTTDGFELTGAPGILISDNPHRQIPNCIGVIELRDSAEVTVNMSPLDLWRRVRHIVTLEREGKTHPSTPDVVFFLAEPGETKQQCLARLIEEDRQYYEELHSREPVWRSISLYGSDDGLPRAADHVDRGPVLIDGVDQTTGMYTEKANADIARAKEESALRDSGITRGPGRWRRGKFTEDRP